MVDDREELRHAERRDPVPSECPTLRRAHGFWTDKFRGQNKWYRTESDAETADEGQRRDDGECRDVVTQGKNQEHGTQPHARDTEQEADLAADLVSERRTEQRDDNVDRRHKDCDQYGGRGKDRPENAHAIHDDAIDAAELLGDHDSDDSDNCFPVLVEPDDVEEGYMGMILFRRGASRGKEGFFFLFICGCVPFFGLVVDVGLWTADLLQHASCNGGLVVFGQPFGAFGCNEKSAELDDSNDACNGENDSPEVVPAEEVAKRLCEEDADVDHDLSESSEEASLVDWGDL